MTETTLRYPQPVTDSDNRPLLEGWRRGELYLQHCRGCGKAVFYPRPLCPHCWSGDLEWRKASGRGTVVSYSRIHRPNHPAFNEEVPIVLAEIRLAEGAALLARILEGEVESGTEVVLMASAEATGRFPLPVFRPAS